MCIKLRPNFSHHQLELFHHHNLPYLHDIIGSIIQETEVIICPVVTLTLFHIWYHRASLSWFFSVKLISITFLYYSCWFSLGISELSDRDYGCSIILVFWTIFRTVVRFDIVFSTFLHVFLMFSVSPWGWTSGFVGVGGSLCFGLGHHHREQFETLAVRWCNPTQISRFFNTLAGTACVSYKSRPTNSIGPQRINGGFVTEGTNGYTHRAQILRCLNVDFIGQR